MPEIGTDAIKALRQITGAGIMDCKRALESAAGDMEKAQELLRQQGTARAAQRVSRTANEGLVDAYIHSGGRIGALIEVNCETDFVARTPDFTNLVHDLALQVAAMNPLYITREEMPENDGLNPEEVCLLHQPFIKDPSQTIQDLIDDVRARTRENVQVRRFERFGLGQE